MEPIVYIDRVTGKREVENIYGAAALKFIYGKDWISKLLGVPLLHIFVKNPLFSAFYGYWQKHPSSRKKIAPFIEKFQIDPSEFLDSVDSFPTFNDFFIRKLKPEVRPIVTDETVAVIPADGRYRAYQNINQTEGFVVKGEKFGLNDLLCDENLAARYAGGAMVMARLCPTDYHRFHFPCSCVPGPTRGINGWLYSVNPIAVKQNIHIFTKNKRTICELQTAQFGTILFLEIGATNVGSIHQTYTPFQTYGKGEEKGYFSFGASSLILLFEPGRIQLDSDLLMATQQNLEVKCLLGQSMGHCYFSRSLDSSLKNSM